MQLIDGRPVFAATDLVGFLACGHRLALERAMLDGLVAKPMRKDPAMDRIAKRGDQHEARYLADLEAEGRSVVRIDKDGYAVAPLTVDGVPVPSDAGTRLREAATQTIEAMRDRADVVYQGTFFNGSWRGHADFLLRRDHGPDEPDSAFGPWHYEVADTKLARHVTASAILQICSYVDQLTVIQGRQPEFLHVVLGGSAREKATHRVDEVMAYYRRVKTEFELAVGLGPVPVPAPVYPPVATYPEPVEHCEVCRWAADCATRRRSDDDLSLVAGASSRHRAALKSRAIRTRGGLGGLELPVSPKVEGIGRDALARIRDQARIQVASDGLPAPRWELLPLDRDNPPHPGRQPELLHVVLGGSAREKATHRVDEVMAYYRRVKTEFEQAVGMGPVPVPAPVYPPVATYPEPVEHCEVCRWAADCATRRRSDDDLSLVAGASSRHRSGAEVAGHPDAACARRAGAAREPEGRGDRP